jgi:hypothetical protein
MIQGSLHLPRPRMQDLWETWSAHLNLNASGHAETGSQHRVVQWMTHNCVAGRSQHSGVVLIQNLSQCVAANIGCLGTACTSKQSINITLPLGKCIKVRLQLSWDCSGDVGLWRDWKSMSEHCIEQSYLPLLFSCQKWALVSNTVIRQAPWQIKEIHLQTPSALRKC